MKGFGSATGVRSPVPALKGRCPSPLDDGAISLCSPALSVQAPVQTDQLGSFTCDRCDYTWTPRVRPVKRCARCKTYFTGKPRKMRRYHQRPDFWAFADKSGGSHACWPWTGSCDGYGYGRYRAQSAHRIAWQLVNGPTQMQILHGCDNPPCVNPEHLHEGTHQMNMRERSERGRTASGARNGRYKHGRYNGVSAQRRARALMERCPDLDGIFETRKQVTV